MSALSTAPRGLTLVIDEAGIDDRNRVCARRSDHAHMAWCAELAARIAEQQARPSWWRTCLQTPALYSTSAPSDLARLWRRSWR